MKRFLIVTAAIVAAAGIIVAIAVVMERGETAPAPTG